MGRIIVIGDLHGRSDWKHIVAAGNFENAIFIGDYFDTHENISAAAQIENFKHIVAFYKAHPAKVILLTGNHDFHYMQGISEHYSGYQNLYAADITALLSENMDCLKMCKTEGRFCFSHAGITKTFLRLNNIKDDEGLEESVNDLFKFRPNAFEFNGYDMTGDDITQSPIWVRPKSLMDDGIERYQVVGHTVMKRIDNTRFPALPLLFVDTLGTSGEYLIIDNGIPSVQNGIAKYL